MSVGIIQAIKYARGQLRLLAKYGDAEERTGAAELDTWLGDLEARHKPATPLPMAAGFSRRDPGATAKPQPQTQ
jgi:hypothetical protein